jgi:hypothetical protein
LFFRGDHYFFGEALEEFFIAREKATVEEREMKLGIVFFDALTLFERAAGGAYAKAEVPQSAREIRDERAELFFSFVIAEEKKNVEIRVGEKEAAAIAAQSDERKSRRFGRVDAQNFTENLLCRFVGERAESVQSFLRASARFKILAYTLPFVFGLWSEDGQGR